MLDLNDIQLDMLEYFLNMPEEKILAGLVYLWLYGARLKLAKLEDEEREVGEQITLRILRKNPAVWALLGET